jgi:hypothetical protein
VICFDDGDADEFNTLLVTDWFAHTPPEVLAKNFGVPADSLAKIPLSQPLDLPRDSARRPGRRLRGGQKGGATNALSVHVPAWRNPAVQGNEELRNSRGRQHQLHSLHQR